MIRFFCCLSFLVIFFPISGFCESAAPDIVEGNTGDSSSLRSRPAKDYANACGAALMALRNETSNNTYGLKPELSLISNRDSIIVFSEDGNRTPKVYSKEGVLNVKKNHCDFDSKDTIDDFVARQVKVETNGFKISVKNCPNTIIREKNKPDTVVLCFSELSSQCAKIGPKTAAAIRNALTLPEAN